MKGVERVREIIEKVIDDTGKSYNILAEIYSQENELIRYIVMNKHGELYDVKRETLEQWRQKGQIRLLNFECIKNSCIYLEIFKDVKEKYEVMQCQHKMNSTWKCCKEDCPLLRGEKDS